MLDLVISNEEKQSENLTKEQKLNATFQNTSMQSIGVCNKSTHVAIFPVRSAIDENMCNYSKECSLTSNSINITTHHYTKRQLRDGWLYVYDITNAAVYEYEVKNSLFKQIDIYPYDKDKSVDKNYLNQNEQKEPLPYIRSPINSIIQLFYSTVKVSDNLRKNYGNWIIFKSIWIKEINLPKYCEQNGIPENNWREIFEKHGINNSARHILVRLEEKKDTYSDSQFSIDSYNLGESVINIGKAYDNAGEIITLGERIHSDINVLFKPESRDNAKKLINELLNIPSSYIDWTAPIADLDLRVADITTEAKFDEESRTFEETSIKISKSDHDQNTIKLITQESILERISGDKPDTKVENQPLNMIATLNDPLAIISDLVMSLDKISVETMCYKSENEEAIIIANTCFDILYPNQSDIGIENHTKEKFEYNYFNKFTELPPADEALEKTHDMVYKNQILSTLKSNENKDRLIYQCELDIIKWLDSFEQNQNISLDNSLGFDCSDLEHYKQLIDVFSNIYTLFSRSPKGSVWIQRELENPKSIGLIFYGFSTQLLDIFRKFYNKNTLFNVTKENKINLELAVNQSAQSVKNIYSMLCNSESDNDINNMLAHILDCIGVIFSQQTIPFMVTEKYHTVLSNYTKVVGFIRKGVNIVFKPKEKYDQQLNNWVKNKSQDLRKLRALEYKMYINKTHKLPSTPYIKEYNNLTASLSKSKPNAYIFTTTNKANILIASLEALLKICDMVITADNISNQTVTTKEKITLISSMASIVSSGLTLHIALLEQRNITYLKNNSTLSKLSNSRIKTLKTNTEMIKKLTQTAAKINLIISCYYFADAIYSLNSATTNEELIWLRINAQLAGASVVLGIIEVGGASFPVVGVILAVSAYIAKKIAMAKHRTDLQIWLEHCKYGKKRDKWTFNSLQDALEALHRVIITPNVDLNKVQSVVPLLNKRTKKDYRNYWFVTNILSRIEFPLHTYNTTITLFCTNKNILNNDKEIKIDLVTSKKTEKSFYELDIPLKVDINDSQDFSDLTFSLKMKISMIIPLPYTDQITQNLQLFSVSFIYDFGTFDNMPEDAELKEHYSIFKNQSDVIKTPSIINLINYDEYLKKPLSRIDKEPFSGMEIIFNKELH